LLQVFAVLVLLVLLNVLTASRSPTVWSDEVVFADPAANLLEGNGLTSTAWPYQTARERWCGNAPLHTWLLIPWIGVFGLTPTSVRAVNYLYMALVGLLLWVAIRRFGLISSPRLRVACVALMLLENAIVFSYRSGRYDALGILLTAAVFAAATMRSSAARVATVVTTGVLVPLTGLQLIPYAVAVALVLLLVFGTQTLRVTAPLGVGIAMGGAALYVILHSIGAWQGFMTSVYRQRVSFEVPTNITQALLSALREPLHMFLDDPSLVPMLMVLLIGLALAGSSDLKTWRRADVAALMLCFVIPVIVGITAHFERFYIWMVSVPVLVGTLTVWDRLRSVSSQPLRSARTVIVFLLGIAGMVGLPARLGVTVLEWKQRDYAQVETLVSRHVRAGDVVFADWQAYYALHHVRARAFYPRYPMSPSEKDAVTMMVIPPQDLPQASKILGGRWHEVGALNSPGRGLGARLYDLAVYARESR
jgi:hypothetical protein